MKRLKQSMACRLLAVLMLMLSAPSALMADTWWIPEGEPEFTSFFNNGMGTQEKPFVITTAQDFANLAWFVNAGASFKGVYFRLGNDIKFNDGVLDGVVKDADGSIHVNENEEHFKSLKAWQPIGVYGSVYDDDFEGIIDGCGHSISGIYCRLPQAKDNNFSDRHVGFFGNCKNARISNLTIKDSFFSIAGGNVKYVGALVGVAKNSTFTNCRVENCVISGDGNAESDYWYIGGMVGKAEGDFTAYNCSFNGTIDAYAWRTYYSEGVFFDSYGGYSYVGGLVGYLENDKTIISDCNTRGTLLCREQHFDLHNKSEAYIGGLAGYGESISDASKRSFTRCVNRMTIKAFTGNFSDVHYSMKKSKYSIHGIISGKAKCDECANLGDIRFGVAGREAVYANLENKNSRAYIGGICQEGTANDCFCYGSFNMAMGYYGNVWSIGQWISQKGTVENSFACNSIDYSFKEGAPTLRLLDSGDVTIGSLVDCNTTLNGTSSGNIEAADFKNPEAVEQLNKHFSKYKYGLITDDADAFNGYLFLTSLGASVNSLNGSGTREDPYLIATGHDLKILGDICNAGEDTYEKVFSLANNIDMTNDEAIYPIGSDEHPFKGRFYGEGHYLRGIKLKEGYLFGVMAGWVIGLTLDEPKSLNKYKFAGIADKVSDGQMFSMIEDCCVTGDFELAVPEEEGREAVFGGICNTLRNGNTGFNKLYACFFHGNIKVTCNPGAKGSLRIGGIIADKTYASVDGCMAIIEYDSDGVTETSDVSLGGIGCEDGDYGGSCFYLGVAAGAQEPTLKGTAGRKESISDLSPTYGYWTYGVQHPVLGAAYHYNCRDYNGKEVWADLTYRKPGNNEILTLVPADDQKTDTKMWQMPNVAVYSDEYDAELLTNFYIIPDTETEHYPLRYKPSKDGVKVMGLATYPWAVKTKAVNWRAFCLPGEVDRADLPDGCKLYVGGRLTATADGDKQSMNIVEVETVPAGVPFLMRYDNKTSDDTLRIVMTGTLSMTPQKADESSSLVGTFEPVEAESGQYMFNTVTEDADGRVALAYDASLPTSSFGAYVMGANSSDIELTDYLLLDEQSNETGDIVAANSGKSVNVKLRRTIRTGGWNTVCLPFDVSEDEVKTLFGENTRVEYLTSVGASAGSVVLTFSKATSMEAGKPYLLYTGDEGYIYDLGQRTIAGAAGENEFKGVNLGDGTLATISMVGSYGKTALLSTDAESQYFIQQDKFYRVVGEPVVSPGFRCWFKVTDATGTKALPLNAARVVHADGTVTDIRLIDTGLGTADTRIYDMQGIRHTDLQRGVNIVGGRKMVKR